MPFSVFFDTCVLHPAYLSDTLLRMADAQMFRPLWSAEVLDELRGSLIDRDLPADSVDRRIAQMCSAFPDAMVTGYESLVSGMDNDPKDRHVLAAAVRSGAEVLVTFNIRDFPEHALKAYDLIAITPDEFLLDQLDLYPGLTISTLRVQAAAYRRDPRSVTGLLSILERTGVRVFAAEVRRHLDSAGT
ncbi:PIN domain-containing protein [Nocardia asteroides]|uniref:PIN domain-containing protein n=1 Tax=Nocardia asteroides TaxID=1824 RepID=UPI001E4516E6|nr:PIN domain-containing protein [Nocardia asteroides]UGT58276.1 PIN domain-containing protein [Nocardia asteroides]